MWKGNLQLNPAMLFSIGLVSTFISGGLTGIILGDSTLDINVHDTYFVVAHFHLVMGISALYGLFAGVYHWFPKMFGKMMNKNLGYVHFWVTAVCAYGVFLPMHFIGMAGLPRRYYTNTAFPYFDDLANINVVITVFALVAGAAQLVLDSCPRLNIKINGSDKSYSAIIDSGADRISCLPKEVYD